MDPNNQAPEQPNEPQHQQPSAPPIAPFPQQVQPPAPIAPPVQPVFNQPQPVQPSQTQLGTNGQPDAGKIFGILSIVLSLFTVIATTLGIIGLIKSRKSGHSGILSIIGIILSVLLLIGSIILLIGFFTGDAFREAYCQEDPTAGFCESLTNIDRPYSSTGAYDYSAVTATTSYTASSYINLVKAASDFSLGPFLDRSAEPGLARQTIRMNSTDVPIVTFDKNGSYDSNGRFAMFIIPNTTRFCYVDYLTNVSLIAVLDPPKGDGNTAILMINNKTNCLDSDPALHGKSGEIKITTSTVSVQPGLPASTNSIAEAIVAQLDNDGIARSVRGHFLSSFPDPRTN